MGEVCPPRSSSSCFSPRRARPFAPHRRMRSTQQPRPATGKPISLLQPRFRPTLSNAPTLRILCASDLPTDSPAYCAQRKLGWAGRCKKVRNANRTHVTHRRALSVRMALRSVAYRGRTSTRRAEAPLDPLSPLRCRSSQLRVEAGRPAKRPTGAERGRIHAASRISAVSGEYQRPPACKSGNRGYPAV
jgi:hypothetical protein